MNTLRQRVILVTLLYTMMAIDYHRRMVAMGLPGIILEVRDRGLVKHEIFAVIHPIIGDSAVDVVKMNLDVLSGMHQPMEWYAPFGDFNPESFKRSQNRQILAVAEYHYRGVSPSGIPEESVRYELLKRVDNLTVSFWKE